MVISVLTQGDIFGETAIFNNKLFPYSAETISDVTMLQLPKNFMMNLTQSHINFDHFLTKFLEQQIVEKKQHCLEAEHLTYMTSAQRVGCFLLKLCGDQKAGPVQVKLPYEKALIASKLGMTPETFSRSLKQLAPFHVEVKRTDIIIHDIRQLREHVCMRCSALEDECMHNGKINVT